MFYLFIYSNDSIYIFMESDNGCITLKHKISRADCSTSEYFTCQLKILALRDFSYAWSRVTIQKLDEGNVPLPVSVV